MARTHKQKWNARNGFALNSSHSKQQIAKAADVPVRILTEVYKRGVGAHKTNPSSVRVKGTFHKDPKVSIKKKLSAEQWGMARVYAFVNKLGGREILNHDQDLAKKIR